MTEKTAIEMLYYSKPPPGYEIHSDWHAPADAGCIRAVPVVEPTEYWRQWQWILESDDTCGDWFGEGDEEEAGGEPAAVADAWAHYKAEHDPPGLVVASAVDDEAERDTALNWHVINLTNKSTAWWRDYPDAKAGEEQGETEARAAAWAWHDRRHALAVKLDSDYRLEGPEDCESGTSVWPRCLTWTDEQVAEVERWLADSTAEMPEVLHA